MDDYSDFVSEKDKHAMSQQIKFNQMHLNDLYTDSKEVTYKKLHNHSIMFDYGTLREGVELRKDGYLRTSKGKTKDPKYHPELIDQEDHLMKAIEFQKKAQAKEDHREYMKNLVRNVTPLITKGAHVEIDRILPRDKAPYFAGVGIHPTNYFPSHMQFRA